MNDKAYVHGYSSSESRRLVDQATTLAELLHWDTAFPANSDVLEAGCGVGAQTVTIARNSPLARIRSVDISPDSLMAAKDCVTRAGLGNVVFQQADIFGGARRTGFGDSIAEGARHLCRFTDRL